MPLTQEQLESVRKAAGEIKDTETTNDIMKRIDTLRRFLNECKNAAPVAPPVVQPSPAVNRVPVVVPAVNPPKVAAAHATAPAPPPDAVNPPLPGFTAAQWAALNEDEKLARRLQAEEEAFALQYDRDIEMAQMFAREGR